MFNSNSTIPTNVFGVSLKTRALSHVVAESDVNRFLVGTIALREENEVCLLEYRENEGVKCLSIFTHPKEIWSITSCPFDQNLFFTVYNTGSEYKSSLWRIPDSNSGGGNQNDLKEEFELKDSKLPHQGLIKPILCDPNSSGDYVISLDDQNIRVWNIQDYSQPKVTKTFGDLKKLSAGCINPNIQNQLATANDTTIKIWDFKSGSITHNIEKAHNGLIRDIDFNPNMKYYLLSAGDDCKLKVWDIRNHLEPVKTVNDPVKVFTGHNHWIWNAKFNKYHDQLIISASSDNTVKLWNLYSLSSAKQSATTATEDNDSSHPQEVKPSTTKKTSKRNEDQLIKTYEEHEDSVYNISWSTSNFLFSSLSYDGRLVINNVPKDYADILSYI